MSILGRVSYSTYAVARRVLRRTGLITALPPEFRAAAARMVYRTFSTNERPLIIRGHRMVLASSGRYAPLDMAGGRFEASTTKLFFNLLKPGDNFVDVGAHVGYYSLLAARLVGETGRVFSFEPEPQNYELLVKNVRANAYKNIMTVQRAIGDQPGQMPLFLSSVDNGLHSLFQLGLPKHGNVTVEVTTLDDYFGAIGWPEIALVKVDIEGGESAALEGMRELIRRSPHIKFIMEFCPWILDALNITARQYLDQIRALGFSIQVIEVNGPVPLEDVDADELVRRLLQEHSYLNLLCTRVAS